MRKSIIGCDTVSYGGSESSPHLERTVLYKVLFHHFERFLEEYDGRFEREYGFLWSIIQEVVERHLDWNNPRCGSLGSVVRTSAGIPADLLLQDEEFQLLLPCQKT